MSKKLVIALFLGSIATAAVAQTPGEMRHEERREAHREMRHEQHREARREARREEHRQERREARHDAHRHH